MSDEHTQASPPPPDPNEPQATAAAAAYDHQPPTGNFPAYEPPPPGTAYTSQPQWSAAPAPAVVRLRLRDHALVGASMVVSLGLVSALGYMWVGDAISVRPATNELQSNGDNAAPANAQNNQNGQNQQNGSGVDLTQAAVFVATNDTKNNEVVAFARGQDGKLKEVGRYATGGTGSGGVEDISQSLVLGSADGEASPTHSIDKAEFLFVPNAGSNSITVFRILPDRLELVTKVPSGGEKPISLTVNRGLLYVLNSGEFDDRFVTGPTSFTENCTTGQLPSVTGFRVSPDGQLNQIEGSTRLLTGEHESGCAQIGFAPDGKTLIATERIAGKRNADTDYGKGAIITWGVRPDGTLNSSTVTEPTGNGPYGFTFTRDGTLLMAEQNGAHLNIGGGFVATYQVNEDSTLTPVGGSVASEGTDTCWLVANDAGDRLFATSPFGGGQIASFAVGKNGELSLLHPAASADNGRDNLADHTGEGVLDVGMSRDARYLYALDGLAGGLLAYRINDNGTLTFLERHQWVNLPSLADGGQGGPNGIASF